MPIFHHKTKADHQAGFSLLEMLVVLAITGMVLSLVGVRLISSIESTRFAQTSKSAVADIKLIRLQAMLDEKTIVIPASDNNLNDINSPEIELRSLNLPEGWDMTGDNILISKTGFCSGGNINIKDNTERQMSFVLMAPKCDIA